VDELKKRRRRKSLLGWVIGLSCFTAVGVVGAIVPMVVMNHHATNATSGLAFETPSWVAPAEAQVHRTGYPWVKLSYAGRAVTVDGDAVDAETAERGFAAAKRVLATRSAAQGQYDFVINNINVAGVPGVGAAFAALAANPDAAACQSAFSDTLAGRFVGFELGSSRITAESGQLLDALSAVAKRCESHLIEIGGHTDMAGTNARNLVLSEERATAVRAYLVERGVSPSQLSAVGYGEERPLMPERSPEADERNRRIEFTVTGL
jgi:outer membrane protein OmpA-like peptidoglycan-associated protein